MSNQNQETMVRLSDVLDLIDQYRGDSENSKLDNLDKNLIQIANKLETFSRKKKEGNLRSIFDSLPVMIALWDKNLINVFSNKIYSDFFSNAVNGVKGKHIREVIGEDLFEKNRCYMEEALKGELQNFEREIPTPDGRIRKTIASYIPYKINDSVAGFVAVVTDISVVKKQSDLFEGQKSFFTKVLNSFHEGLVIHDKNGEIIYSNDIVSKILGLSDAQLRGKSSLDPYWRVLHEDGSDFPGEEHPSMQTIKTGKACLNVRMGVRTSLQEVRWLNVNSFPFTESFDNVESAVLVTFTDITEQYLNERMLSSLIHSSPGMIYKFKLTKEGVMSFPFVSSKGFEIYEITKEDFENSPDIFVKMIHEDDRDSQVIETQKSAVNLSEFEWTGRVVTKAGAIKWIRINGSPTLDHEENIVYDGIVIDVTKEKQLQNDLNAERMKSLQNAKLASLGELSAGVAHEINNPLSIISGINKTLHNYVANSDLFEEKTKKIDKAVERISKIVNGLKRFSRLDMSSSKSNVLLNKLIDDALIFIRIKCKQEEIRLEVGDYVNSTLNCNVIEIEQVLINLVNNAADSIRSSENKWISIEFNQSPTSVIIDVVDSGPGIPNEFLSRIFDPFFTTKKIGEGTGLGLSISRGIIKDHSGELNYLKKEGHSCFRIELPLSASE